MGNDWTLTVSDQGGEAEPVDEVVEVGDNALPEAVDPAHQLRETVSHIFVLFLIHTHSLAPINL